MFDLSMTSGPFARGVPESRCGGARSAGSGGDRRPVRSDVCSSSVRIWPVAPDMRKLTAGRWVSSPERD
jgi:hypothetical protein